MKLVGAVRVTPGAPISKAIPKPKPSVPGYKMGEADIEYYKGIGGNRVAELVKAKKFPESPDHVAKLKKLDAPQQWGNQYGSRIRCYILPKKTGDYTFWIASDDFSELYLSQNNNPENKQRIAHLDGAVGHKQWDAKPSQKSATFQLKADRGYYLEVLHKEGGGHDHVEVAWQGPGIKRRVIQRPYIASYKDSDVKPDPVVECEALSFNGKGAHAVSNLKDLSGDAITIEYWFKGKSTQSAVRQQGGAGFIVAGWNGKHILSNDGSTNGLPTGNATDGKWHHLAMTWERHTTDGFVTSSMVT